nr:PREDICTED: uncharacterized protein LOC108211197 isoform X2 [Daucus carota subsp. sativus]
MTRMIEIENYYAHYTNSGQLRRISYDGKGGVQNLRRSAKLTTETNIHTWLEGAGGARKNTILGHPRIRPADVPGLELDLSRP